MLQEREANGFAMTLLNLRLGRSALGSASPPSPPWASR